MASLTCVVVTPEKTALDEKADFVALPLYDGEIGIGAGRSPMIGRLGFGEMRIRKGSQVERYYLDGGFVQVVDGTISVLTNRAVPASMIDAAAARKQLDEARRRTATSDEAFEIRDRAVTQARAQLRIAERQGS